MKRNTFKRLAAAVLALVMVVTVLPAGIALPVRAEQPEVSYLSYFWDPLTQALSVDNYIISDYTVVT